MRIDLIKRDSLIYNKELNRIKKIIEDKNNFKFYPYGIMNNFIHLENLLKGNNLENFFGNLKNKNILDIGAADGDMSFYLKKMGFNPTIVEYNKTNFNGLRGAKKLNEYLNTNIEIIDNNIDELSINTLPNKKYGVVLLLGIFYHLQNPYHILRELSKCSKYVILSTRITRYTPKGKYIDDESLAYLVSPNELNNDSTNYWIFTFTGLTRIIERTGYKIIKYIRVGDTETSNPCDNKKDERVFMLIENNAY